MVSGAYKKPPGSEAGRVNESVIVVSRATVQVKKPQGNRPRGFSCARQCASDQYLAMTATGYLPQSNR